MLDLFSRPAQRSVVCASSRSREAAEVIEYRRQWQEAFEEQQRRPDEPNDGLVLKAKELDVRMQLLVRFHGVEMIVSDSWGGDDWFRFMGKVLPTELISLLIL